MPRNESSRSAGKRPMRAMTPQEKMDAIGRVHGGESKAAVARDIGVPESTLRGWCKAEDKIRAQLNNVRTTGTYDHILTSSSENSDNSRAGSSSRSTPTQNTMGMSTCGVAERVNEEPEAGPAPKRPKMENNLTSVAAAAAINMNTMNNMSTSARTPLINDLNPLLTNPAFLYNMLTLGDEKTLAALNSFMTRGTSSSHSAYLAPAVNLLESLHRNNGAMGSTMAMSMGNMLPTSNALINGKRRYNTHGIAPTAEIPPRVTARRQNNQSPNAEKPSGSISQPTNNRASPMPSTSASNGSVANNSKSSKDCKKLDDILRQLRQPGAGQSECSIAEILANNAMNNNNNNVDHVDNETSENSLPPEFAVVLEYGTKFADWLQKYGSAICTFRQVIQIRDILKNMSTWAESKEIESKEQSNGTS
ncbi:uncharacterized protein Dan [Temnothorax longispinosus]|uniref:HTH psq-type domain-containing protein n=1 Tax=Temnothorax longispinosus TaxID=300112 RepID=A0A4S2L1I0_9HYME|nr:Uncharacterized protein DBV15_07129 [Temnothorax longispinosus]